MTDRLRVEVPPPLTGARLDRFLAGLHEVGSRGAAERLVEEGRVLVDGATRHKSFRVLPGMSVEVDVPAAVLGPLVHDADVPHRVAYEDDALIVVDKPAGVVVHPAPGSMDGTLVQALHGRGLAGGDDPLRPGVVHRLDKDTSGLLVLAKGEDVRAALADALRERRVERTYRALVHGRPAARAGRIEAPIGRDHGRLTRQAVDGVAARDARAGPILDLPKPPTSDRGDGEYRTGPEAAAATRATAGSATRPAGTSVGPSSSRVTPLSVDRTSPLYGGARGGGNGSGGPSRVSVGRVGGGQPSTRAASSAASRSGGSGLSNASGSPLRGCVNASRTACRNWRSSPSAGALAAP